MCNCIRVLGPFLSARIKPHFRFRKKKLSFEVCQNGTETHKLHEKGIFLGLEKSFLPLLLPHYQIEQKVKTLLFTI